MFKSIRKFRTAVFKSFTSTIGILLALALIAGIAYGVVAIHDLVVGASYTDQAKLSEDNSWGGLLVSIDLTKNEAVPVRTEQCIPFSIRGSEIYPLDCHKNQNTGVYERTAGGYVAIDGNIYVKNRYWLKNKKIPSDLVQFKFNNRSITPETSSITFGSFLRPGAGTSGKFSIRLGSDAVAGKLFLQDGNRQAELIK